MFIDASAIVAILGREPGHEELEKRLAAFGGPLFVSPLVKFEASVALARQKAIAGEGTPSSEILQQAHQAVDAFVEDVSAEETPYLRRSAASHSMLALPTERPSVTWPLSISAIASRTPAPRPSRRRFSTRGTTFPPPTSPDIWRTGRGANARHARDSRPRATA